MVRKAEKDREESVEELLARQLKREMFITPEKKVRVVDEWDTIMQTVYELPIEYDGYVKRVYELEMLREMVDLLARGEYDDVKRSESRRKQLTQFTKTMHMYFNLIFKKGKVKTGYGALIYFPRIREDEPERSGGIVLIARYRVEDGKGELKFEKAKFDDFLLEVRPYVELLGDLYRGRKP